MKFPLLVLPLLLLTFSCRDNDNDKKAAAAPVQQQRMTLNSPYQITFFGHDRRDNYYTYTFNFSDKILKHVYLTPHGDEGVKSVDNDEVQVSDVEHDLINSTLLSMTIPDQTINCKSENMTEGLEIRDMNKIQFYSSEEQGESCFGRPVKAGPIEKIKEQFIRLLSHDGM